MTTSLATEATSKENEETCCRSHGMGQPAAEIKIKRTAYIEEEKLKGENESRGGDRSFPLCGKPPPRLLSGERNIEGSDSLFREG